MPYKEYLEGRRIYVETFLNIKRLMDIGSGVVCVIKKPSGERSTHTHKCKN
jgi:hypothetical protein